MDQEEHLLVGKIVGLHGLKGDLKVHSYTDTLDVYRAGHSVLIQSAGGTNRVYVIEKAKPHKKVVLLSLRSISAIHSAERFIGSDIFVKKQSLPELEKGTYYWFDIIGLPVFSKENTCIGSITSIIPTGGHDVYVVKGADKDEDREILIPAIETVVLEIDLINKRMTVDLPEGL